MSENTDDKNVVTMPDGRRFRVNDDGSVTVLDGAQGMENMPAEKEDKEAQQKAGDALKQGKEKLSAGKSKRIRKQLKAQMEPQLPIEPFEANVDKLIHFLEQLRVPTVQPEQLNLEQLETLARLMVPGPEKEKLLVGLDKIKLCVEQAEDLARLLGPGPKQEKVLTVLDKMKRIQKQLETLARPMVPRSEQEKVKMSAYLDKIKLGVEQVEDMTRLMGPGPEKEELLADLDKMKRIQKACEILARGWQK